MHSRPLASQLLQVVLTPVLIHLTLLRRHRTQAIDDLIFCADACLAEGTAVLLPSADGGCCVGCAVSSRAERSVTGSAIEPVREVFGGRGLCSCAESELERNGLLGESVGFGDSKADNGREVGCEIVPLGTRMQRGEVCERQELRGYG